MKQVVAFAGAERTVATLTCTKEGHEAYTVEVAGPWGEVSAGGPDAFEALVNVRKWLENLGGWRLALTGARRDVYPSGMAREAGGTRAYVLRPRERARETVYIFDEEEENLVASVAEQEEYFQYCTESFR